MYLIVYPLILISTMEQKPIYLVKYSLGEYGDYRENVHSAYEDNDDARLVKLDVYINILNAFRQLEKGEIDIYTSLEDKQIKDWDEFIVDKNKVWVEQLNYYPKK